MSIALAIFIGSLIMEAPRTQSINPAAELTSTTKGTRVMANSSISRQLAYINKIGRPPLNLSGKIFGRLVVNEMYRINGKLYWECTCSCGNVVDVMPGSLTGGNTSSCGCLKRETSRKSGLAKRKTEIGSHSKEYQIWRGMKKRGHLKTDPAYYRYGGRGITVCDRWQESFENFFSDMGECPKTMCLERIDNNSGYSPENCKWATYKEQMRNKRNNHTLTFNGETRCISEWASLTGVRKDTLRRRIVNLGWSIEKALLAK